MNDRDEFDNMMGREFAQPASEVGPYGYPVQPVKPGLTKRGKAALAIGVTVLAGGGLLTWQHYNTQAKASEIQAQELQYKRDLLALEMQKELNKANAANQKAEQTQDAAQQKMIQACVDADKGLIGKQLGVTYRSVMSDCKAQYGTSSNTGAGMQEAASATDTDTGGAGLNQGLLIGGGVLGLVLVVAAKKATRPSHA